MNRYPLWVYVTIAGALVLGALYTLPNFFGEAPAVQVSSARAALNPDPQNPNYTVALNLLPNSPRWLSAIHALPMYLGLDLRGGVHFLLQVDMRAAIAKRAEGLAGDIRSQLRDKNVRHAGIAREGDSIVIRFRDAETRDKARAIIGEQIPDLQLTDVSVGGELRLVATIRPEAQKRTQEFALKQNIQTLHNRINELGVAEPVIQQQGSDRVVVQLPGVQDTAKAKEILGRTATLEVRMVDEDNMHAAALAAARAGQAPFVDAFYIERNDVALLLRAGALAAPMEIVEERTVGPSLGADNIKKGFDSTIYGFAALSLFIVVYYSLFGVFSTLALCANLLFLIALLSMLQATLTLPGIAAIALTLGMAIDANVLINERVREELRGGATPQAAI